MEAADEDGGGTFRRTRAGLSPAVAHVRPPLGVAFRRYPKRAALGAALMTTRSHLFAVGNLAGALPGSSSSIAEPLTKVDTLRGPAACSATSPDLVSAISTAAAGSAARYMGSWPSAPARRPRPVSVDDQADARVRPRMSDSGIISDQK